MTCRRYTPLSLIPLSGYLIINNNKKMKTLSIQFLAEIKTSYYTDNKLRLTTEYNNNKKLITVNGEDLTYKEMYTKFNENFKNLAQAISMIRSTIENFSMDLKNSSSFQIVSMQKTQCLKKPWFCVLTR